MTEEEARRDVVRYWLGQARDALASAHSEAAAARLNFAVNRAYYACFYAASAVLLSEGRKFVKHSGVRAALHRHLVKTGRIEPDLG
ncbi:MAG: HEPN domain-containing protein [Phycisphaerae bacterium]|nr:HEPN domain-containing protein [Phycisphaerae bacterium]